MTHYSKCLSTLPRRATSFAIASAAYSSCASEALYRSIVRVLFICLVSLVGKESLLQDRLAVNSNLIKRRNKLLIPNDELCYKSVIGKWGDKVLYGYGTVGGLHLVEARSVDGSKEIIGAGSHRAVARHIAKRMHPGVEFTCLEKSQEVDPRDFADVLPFWEAVVARVQQNRG